MREDEVIPLDHLLTLAREARDSTHVGTERYLVLSKFTLAFDPATAVRALERLRAAEEALCWYGFESNYDCQFFAETGKHPVVPLTALDEDLGERARAHFEKYPEAK